MTRHRKLPSPTEVSRLLWLDELTVRQIAERYNCWTSAVYRYMEKHGIPVRPQRHEHCIVEGCHAHVCQMKRWIRGKYEWRWAPRCYRHQQLSTRARQRNYDRRTKPYYGRKRKALVTAVTQSTWIRDPLR